MVFSHSTLNMFKLERINFVNDNNYSIQETSYANNFKTKRLIYSEPLKNI